jgi:hypothetical protein
LLLRFDSESRRVWTGNDTLEGLDRRLNDLAARDGDVAAGYLALIDPQFEKHENRRPRRALIFKANGG